MLQAIAIKRNLLLGVMLLFVAVFVAPGRSLAKLDDNLVGYWSFDDCTATDNSGHGNNGTINGADCVDSKPGLGKAYRFDVDADHIEFSTPILNTPPYTWCAWVKAESLSSSSRYILSNGGQTGESYGIYMYINSSNQFSFGCFDIAGNGSVEVGVPATTDWAFLCGVWDGTYGTAKVKLYLNGSLVATGNTVHWGGGPPQNFVIGSPSNDHESYGWLGLIDEVRIYNRVLSDAEIQDLYNHPGGLIANFSAEPDSGFRPLSVSFTDLSVGSPTSWFWDFGDGNTYTVQNPVHVYADTGLFDVKLIISDSLYSDTIIKPNYIAVFDTLTVDFSAQPTHGRKPLTVSFHSLCSAVPQRVTWYFGDGDSSQDLNPVHQYADLGNYEVKFVAELFGYKDSLTKEDYIQVSDIKAGFGVDKRCGPAPLTVAFSDSSTGTNSIIGWHWDFGDGDTSNQRNPTHQFTATQVFDVTLIVSDSIGADTLTKNDFITTQDSVSADFNGFPASGKPPLTVMFEPVLGGIANQFFWDFGDGDTSTLRNPIHTYATAGKYDVKLNVKLELDGCSQVDSIIKEDYIVVNDLQAQFSANPTAGVAPLSVQFNDESSGIPNLWFWNFGDGNTSTAQHPQHQYDTAGVFYVFLRVSNPVGSDSLLKLSYLRVDTAYADLYAEIYGPWGSRPGFVLDYYFVWTNLGTTSAESCTLKILLPSQMVFEELYDTSGAPFPGYSFSGDTIIAPLGTIVPLDWYGGYVYAHGHLPESVPIGDILVCQMWLTSPTPDRNYENNYDSLSQAVIGSWDPNDKLAYPVGEGVSHSIKPDQRLTYMIQFENKREATADAIYIRVVDTLDQDLDWGTLAMEASSHPDKCHYEFDPYTGEIVWFCDSIMLPPNVNPPEGEGYFTFSISPKSNLAEGKEIANSAWIRFDYNPWLQAPEEGPVIRTIHYPFILGDANRDGVIDVGDVVYLINYLFKNGPAPNPLLAGDANCDGVVDVGDVVYLINYLFKGGPPPSCKL